MKRRNQGQNRQGRQGSKRPGAGKGSERERGSGIYPSSGPLPPGPARFKSAGSLGRRTESAEGSSSSALIRSAPSTKRTPPRRAEVRQKFSKIAGDSPTDIRREDWIEFLNDFSQRHEGWMAEILVYLPDQTSRIEARELPLGGVTADLKPRTGLISIMAGTEAADHLTHTVARTTRITALNDDELEIEAADMGRTILRCHKSD